MKVRELLNNCTDGAREGVSSSHDCNCSEPTGGITSQFLLVDGIRPDPVEQTG